MDDEILRLRRQAAVATPDVVRLPIEEVAATMGVVDAVVEVRRQGLSFKHRPDNVMHSTAARVAAMIAGVHHRHAVNREALHSGATVAVMK